MLSCGTKGLVHEVSQVIAYLSFDVTYYIEVKSSRGCSGGKYTPPPPPKKKNQFWTLQADVKRQPKIKR